jgi:hypothetical protein
MGRCIQPSAGGGLCSAGFGAWLAYLFPSLFTYQMLFKPRRITTQTRKLWKGTSCRFAFPPTRGRIRLSFQGHWRIGVLSWNIVRSSDSEYLPLTDAGADLWLAQFPDSWRFRVEAGRVDHDSTKILDFSLGVCLLSTAAYSQQRRH